MLKISQQLKKLFQKFQGIKFQNHTQIQYPGLQYQAKFINKTLKFPFSNQQVNKSQKVYEEAFNRASNLSTLEDYWREHLENVEWTQKPQEILDKSNTNKALWRWFPDGELNITYNCIDRHLDLGDQPAIFWYSSMEKNEDVISWKQLYENVGKFATVLKNQGVQKGDTVIIYMPMIPQSIFTMLACARIGAVHSVVFGGFAAQELANRIIDCNPKIVVLASAGIEPSGVLKYKEIVDQALIFSKREKTIKTIIYQRKDVHIAKNIQEGRDLDFDQLMAETNEIHPPVSVKSTDPLYMIYTSGTTGMPKGIVRDVGGTAVALTWAMQYIMNVGKGERYFAASDIGWVVSHTFTIYGPLLVGASTVFYEGKPIGTPDAGIFFKLIEKYKVQGIFFSPTALRIIRKEDIEGKLIKKYDLSSLNMLSIAGERSDVVSFKWMQQFVKCVVNDNYWQTESGWPIASNYQNLFTFPVKPGTACKPVPGMNVEILDDQNKIIKEPNKLGRICLRLPLPPSFAFTIWGNQQAYLDKYFSLSQNHYETSDCGYFDQDGYLNVMSRTDDVINTAGHRLSTAQIEEILMSHESISEAAVVAKTDEIKGQIPVGFIVLKQGIKTDNPTQLEKECVKLVRNKIGPVAAFKNIVVVDKLPKTRSQKIIRNLLQKIIDGKPIKKIPPTIEDHAVIPVIQQIVKKISKLEAQKLVFSEEVDNLQDQLSSQMDNFEEKDKQK